MRFHFDQHRYDQLAGWLVGDNPSYIPVFKVELDNSHSRTLQANVWRPDLADARLHDTGQCGFVIDDTVIPGFSQAMSVSITDQKSNRVIYRRSLDRPQIGKKLFILNNLPLFSRSLRRSLESQFLLFYPMMENGGVSTALALMRNNAINSIAGESRFQMLPNIELFRSSQVQLSAFLIEPFTELANRILFTRALQTSRGARQIAMLPAHLSELSGPAVRLNTISSSDVASAFIGLSESQLNVIQDPLTRMLACGPGEMAEPRHVSSALTMLSEFNSVGVANRAEAYIEALRSHIPDLHIDEIEFFTMPEAAELAELLRTDFTVNRLLRNDVRLFRYVDESIQQALAPSSLTPSLMEVVHAVSKG